MLINNAIIYCSAKVRLLSDNEAEVRRLDGELHGASGDARLHLQQKRRDAQTQGQALVRRHSALMGPSGSASALSASPASTGPAGSRRRCR